MARGQPKNPRGLKTTGKDAPVADEEMDLDQFQPDPDPAEFENPQQEMNTAPTEQPAPTSQPSNPVPAQRVYANELVIDHDLYKLELKNMKKNMAWEAGVYDIHDVNHEHFFHTMDSSGRKLKYSNMVGGHFHEMTVIPQPNGAPPIVKCGPAIREVRKLVNKKMVKKFEPALRYANDQGEMVTDSHVHEVTYIRSNKIPTRKINDEAIKVISQDAMKATPPPGVIG